MPTITSPSGLDRPVVPRALRDTLDLNADRRVRIGHVTFWLVAGVIGWATLIGIGWLAVEMIGRLLT